MPVSKYYRRRTMGQGGTTAPPQSRPHDKGLIEICAAAEAKALLNEPPAMVNEEARKAYSLELVTTSQAVERTIDLIFVTAEIDELAPEATFPDDPEAID